MEGWILLAMIAVLSAGVFIFRFPTGSALALSAITGAMLCGEGLAIRHLAEGAMLYLDPILIVFTSMIFMTVFEQSGALGSLNNIIVRSFGKTPFLLLIVMTLFIMFPGMVTGLTTPCILTTGAMVAPLLLSAGMPPAAAAAFIATAAFFGMVAPPVNICAMLICSGVDMPYVGFDLPLLLATFPLAITSSFIIAGKYFKNLDASKLSGITGINLPGGTFLFLPLFVLLILLLGSKYFPQYIPNVGVPLMFIIAALTGLFTGSKIKISDVAESAFRQSLPIMGLLAGIGMFIQILTLSGARGWIVINVLELPSWAQYFGTAIFVPLFGGVSAYGSSVVLGVPLLLAMLQQNTIIVAAALSMIASVGDFLPPTRLAVVLAAPVVGENRPMQIMKYCMIPALLATLLGIAMIHFANPIARWLGLS